MNKIIVVGIIILSLFAISFTVSAAFVLDETLTFGGYLNATVSPPPPTFVLDETLTFGGYLDASAVVNTDVYFDNPSPSNNSIEQELSFTYTVDVQDDEGNLVDWKVTCLSFSDTGNTNDTASLSLSGLSYSTEYTVHCYANDTSNSTYQFYNFTTKDASAFVLDSTLTFGGYLDVTSIADTPPVIENNSVVNGSYEQNIAFTYTVDFWDAEGNFNWWMNCSNSQTDSGNIDDTGSVALSGLSYYTKYWMNCTAKDANNETYKSYGFVTKNASVSAFVLDHTLTFGGYLDVTTSNPVISNVYPSNGSISIVAYPQLRITVTDPNALNMDVSWSTNATGTWTQTNTTVASGSTIYQRATFANTSETKYWWTVKVNNSNGEWTNRTYHFTLDNYTWGEWSGWWVVYYTNCDEPLNLVSQANSSSMVYLSWTPGNNSDRTHIQYDPVSYPTAISEGNLSYNNTGSNHEQSGLQPSTTYYFTAWSYNGVNVTMSFNSSTTSSTTNSNAAPSIVDTNPVNNSNGVSINLANIYFNITDPNGDMMNYSYKYLIEGCGAIGSCAGPVSNGSYVIIINTGACCPLDHNTQYSWWLNVTDDFTYTNKTFYFTTEQILPPSSFTATTHNQTQIDLTWTNTDTSDKTTIIRNETGYAGFPTSLTNGTLIYNDTGTNYENTELILGTTYYYAAWTWNATSSLHSPNSATDSATTNSPGEVVFTNFVLSSTIRHTTTVTASPSDYINFSITATNVASIQINITDAFSVIHTESILANKSGDNYWCNRTLPPGWGNGTYSVKIYASSASVSNESSSNSFNMYPVCDVNMNNWTTATDITQIIGSNWGSSGVNRFCVEDVNGNGWVTATDITYVIDPNRWGAVTKP